ncbi:hypothetical protein [Martelella sp. AD-3]|uniref:hypothetical protein n=1 Tax=Martelella sp. AD-3 TaxID=686597 RepID=UPI000463CFA9|nr:hypothetical protein [Martelella sp. AD-3]AMM83915.1 hypothetical protein AZF01_05690 [Martelella sp. AD-3]MAM09619.1 hypothetical protein [Rhizobiaceae bacterium]
MSVETAALYAALAFVTFLMPSGRMLEFAKWHCQRRLKASLSIAMGIIVVRAVFFAAGLGASVALVYAMPDGRALAVVAASVFLAVFAVRRLVALKRPSPIAGNDNLPARTFHARLWYGIRFDTRPAGEVLLAAATAIFFVPSGLPGRATLELFAAAHLAASLLALLVYGVFARALLARVNRRLDRSRQERIARLLRSGLPSVSARFRRDAA